MIFEIMKDAITYSMQDIKSILKIGMFFIVSIIIIPLLVLGLCHLLPNVGIMLSIILGGISFIILLLIIEGYFYKVIEYSLKGTINFKEPLPKINNFLSLLFRGLKSVLVRIIWMIPCFIIFLLLLYESTYIEYMLIPVIAVWLICYFVSIISVVHMIYNNGSVECAFKLKELFNIIKSIGVNVYLEFYVFLLVILIGSFVLLTFGVTVLSYIFSMIISQIFFSTFLNNMLFSWTALILMTIITLCFMLPIYKLLESRAIGSLYNLRE